MILSNDKNQLDRKTAKKYSTVFIYLLYEYSKRSSSRLYNRLYSRLYNLFARAARRPAVDRTQP